MFPLILSGFGSLLAIICTPDWPPKIETRSVDLVIYIYFGKVIPKNEPPTWEIVRKRLKSWEINNLAML